MYQKAAFGRQARQEGQPEYFDFFGSLLTTAMVNCAKWLHPGGCTQCSSPLC